MFSEYDRVDAGCGYLLSMYCIIKGFGRLEGSYD